MTEIPLWKHGIQEVNGSLVYYSSPTITETAIKPVPTVDVPSGTTISRVNTLSEPKSDIPQAAKDIFTQSPILWGVERVTDLYGLAVGSATTKTDILTDYLPIDTATADFIKEEIKTGADEPKTGWQNEPMLTMPGVEPISVPSLNLPDLGSIGKYALIGVGVLAGIYLLGKSLGRGK